jgi:chromosome segregation ATPase
MGVHAIRQGFTKGSAAPQPSAERQKLAEAIADLRELETEIKAIRDAIAATEETRRHASEVLESTNEKIETAKATAAENMVNRALGRSIDKPVDLARLRIEAASAQDEMEAAAAARAHLLEKLGETEFRLPFKRDAVDKAWVAAAQASPELQRLLQDYATAAQTYSDILNIFRNGVPSDIYNERLVLPAPDVTLAARWKTAIEALKKDAGASLP